MEILLQLLNLFLSNNGGEKFLPIFNLLRENSFNIKSLLSNLTPEMVSPIIQQFMNGQNKISPEFTSSEQDFFGLTPISNICDKDIVNCLNGYFA